MNRVVGFFAPQGLTSAPFIGTVVVSVFSVLLLAVLRFGLPIWSLLIVVAAVAYGFAVLHRPVIGVYVVVAVFFTPIRFSIGVSLLQTVGAGTAALLLLWFLYHRHKIVFGTFMIPLLVLGPMVLISMLYTRDEVATLMYFRRWVFNMMFVLLLLNLVTKFSMFKKVLWSIMIMASLNSVVAMFEYARATDHYHRSIGLMENANNFGHLATLAFPLAFYQYLNGKGWLRWAGLLLAGTLVGGIVVSVSRGALVSLIVVFCAIAFLERRRILPILLVLGMALAATPLLPTYFVERVGNLATDVKNSVSIGDSNRLTTRGHLNTAGLRIWSAHPIMGVGVGNFGFYYNQRQFIGGMTASYEVVAHNIYIQALAEMGTLGGVVLFWLLLNSGSSILRARRATRGSPERWLYFGALEMMTLAILVNTASSGSLMGNDLWMFLGLTMIADRVAKAD